MPEPPVLGMCMKPRVGLAPCSIRRTDLAPPPAAPAGDELLGQRWLARRPASCSWARVPGPEVLYAAGRVIKSAPFVAFRVYAKIPGASEMQRLPAGANRLSAPPPTRAPRDRRRQGPTRAARTSSASARRRPVPLALQHALAEPRGCSCRRSRKSTSSTCARAGAPLVDPADASKTRRGSSGRSLISGLLRRARRPAAAGGRLVSGGLRPSARGRTDQRRDHPGLFLPARDGRAPRPGDQSCDADPLHYPRPCRPGAVAARMNAEKRSRTEIGPRRSPTRGPSPGSSPAVPIGRTSSAGRRSFRPDQLLYLPYPRIADDPEGFLARSRPSSAPRSTATGPGGAGVSHPAGRGRPRGPGFERLFAPERAWLVDRFGPGFGS